MRQKKATSHNIQSIQKKENTLFESTLYMAVIIGIGAFYYGMAFFAYLNDHPHQGIGGALGDCTEYLTRVDKLFNLSAMGNAFLLTLFVELIVMAFYFMDKMKVHHDINTLKGSSEWADHHKIIQKYADCSDKKGKNYKSVETNIPLSKNIYVSLNTKKHFHALNTLITGTTGSGKSRYFLKPNLLQMNSSYVITDPKGEILDACGEMLRRKVSIL